VHRLSCVLGVLLPIYDSHQTSGGKTYIKFISIK